MAEIFIRKQKIRPGKTERLREWISKMDNKAEADSQGVREIWSEESLHTISLFIEHAEDGDYFVWYLEADSMEQLIDARGASTHPLHDVEDAMMEEVLENPNEGGDFEPLIHGVSHERPNNFEVQQYVEES
ncbi:hypothetical protein C457_10936 [Haloferax prahovense DSM 18310]|uniref:ABM domain-containing protein n=1 Tax=Haloferax prahovense (strain DSM 18310 / JCM 13924 / TL6) TaxID=1227461 RepID=M0G909_HALPT|nr:DUF6176 family protein [Haloferax prahovense]ELZ68771.1 hypothetical protein C457_10936 [Haloferax prahovense DSM 18310]